MSQYDNIVADYGSGAAQAIGAILQRGITLGESIASMARQIATALGESLWRAITLAKNAIIGAFRSGSQDAARGSGDAIGWYWICSFANSCIACILMHGTKHSLDEEMDSHTNCGCTQQFYSAQDEQDDSMQSGEDWFSEQDDTTQEDILGPTRYQAWQDGDASLMDMMGTGDDGLHVKTLKELGLR